MPRYASYGRLDSQLIDDGDTAFARINQRLRPDQLKSGEVAVSQNGRMDVDGAWQPRRGYRNVFANITSGAGVPVLPIALPFMLNDAAVNSIFGTALYSDANSSSTEYIVLATNTSAKLVNTSSLVATTINYPSGQTVDSTCNVLQAFQNLFIFRDGQVAFVWRGFCPAITGALRYGNYAKITFNGNHNIVAGDSVTVAGIWGYSVSNPNGTFTVTSVTATEIYYYNSGWDESWGFDSATVTSGFQLCDHGAYTQPLVYDDLGNTEISEGIVTIETPSAHDVEVGDLVTISDKGSTDLNPLAQYRVYEVTTSSPYTFKFKADAANVTGVTTSVGKRQSVGLGFTHMPTPPWAIYHQRRLWMPFNYTMSGTTGGPVIKPRNVKDELIASDILDETTYDQIQNQFKIASGGSDYIVGLHPFAEDNLIVFCRNSIHLIRGVGADLSNSTVQEITREVGAVSRRSIVQVGNQILFLSDNGVYAVDFDQLYNLRGATLPLSEPVNPLMARINRSYAANAIGIYHDNRYYLAVPLDSSTVNNTVLVYNFLNQGWESVDVINDARWNITGFVRSGAGTTNRLHVISKDGGIHLIDEASSGNTNDYQDYLCLAIGGSAAYYDVDSMLTTRQYTYSTMDRKRFNAYELHVESAENIQSNATMSLEVENPDSTVDLSSILSVYGQNVPAAEDLSLRGRLGNKRGYGAQMTIEPTFGRPKVRAIKITGALQNGGTTSAE